MPRSRRSPRRASRRPCLLLLAAALAAVPPANAQSPLTPASPPRSVGPAAASLRSAVTPRVLQPTAAAEILTSGAAARASSGRAVLRGAVIGALVGALGGVAMGAWVCEQGFGCSDRGRGIAAWTLAGAGAGALTGWVLQATRGD